MKPDAFSRVADDVREVDGLIDPSWYPNERDRGVPTGILGMVAALRHEGPHALKVCKARTYPNRHMDALGKKVYKRFCEACRDPS